MTDTPLFAGSCIRTYSGQYIDLLDPRPEHIHIEDIAHALSTMPRFAGHLKHPYTVAQHSIFCYHKAPSNHKLVALLHDATEAYLMDLPSPLKNALPGYKLIEAKLQRVIFDRYGVGCRIPEIVKQIDREALEWEWQNLAIDRRDYSRHPAEIKRAFIHLFNRHEND